MGEDTINGKNIWITGASKGIGLALAELLFLSEAKVIGTARTDENDLNDRAKYLYAKDNCHYFQADVADKDSISATYLKILQYLGQIDILINNAGVGLFKSFMETSVDEFDSVTNTNYRGVFLCTKAVLSNMIEKKSGTIVNIISTAAIKTYSNSSVYSASKAAVKSMTNSLREELREYNINIINVFPGAVDTAIWDDNSRAKYKANMMSPENVASAVVNSITASLNNTLMVEDLVLRSNAGDI